MQTFLKFLLYGLVYSGSVHAQSRPQIVPHYPETAYLTERLLPFTIFDNQNEGRGGGLRLQSVHFVKGRSCYNMIDPFYKKTFHIYCKKPGVVLARILFLMENGEEFQVNLDEFYVRDRTE